jgi:hypothetical protein
MIVLAVSLTVDINALLRLSSTPMRESTGVVQNAFE